MGDVAKIKLFSEFPLNPNLAILLEAGVWEHYIFVFS
jgi:hypothetical protein